MEQKLNSVTSAGTKDDSSNVADVTTSAPIMPNPMLAAGLIQRTQFYIIVSPKDVIQIHTMSWLRKEAIAKFTSGSVYTWVDCKNNGWSCEKFDVSFKKVK